jgi:hypothetical protein
MLSTNTKNHMFPSFVQKPKIHSLYKKAPKISLCKNTKSSSVQKHQILFCAKKTKNSFSINTHCIPLQTNKLHFPIKIPHISDLRHFSNCKLDSPLSLLQTQTKTSQTINFKV